MPSMLADSLIDAVVKQMAINPRGIHGLNHWARVYANGMRLAQTNGADPDVVELFALFHDSRRLSDNADPEHGPRGAELAVQLYGNLLIVEEEKLQVLLTACRLHTSARTHDNLTVQTCFDADRLDLARIGTIVDPEYLCTSAAKDPQTLAWASQQSITRVVPDNPLGWALARISH
ncbi:MAG: HD domain-containing protein [Desulfobulbus sp.]